MTVGDLVRAIVDPSDVYSQVEALRSLDRLRPAQIPEELIQFLNGFLTDDAVRAGFVGLILLASQPESTEVKKLGPTYARIFIGSLQEIDPELSGECSEKLKNIGVSNLEPIWAADFFVDEFSTLADHYFVREALLLLR